MSFGCRHWGRCLWSAGDEGVAGDGVGAVGGGVGAVGVGGGVGAVGVGGGFG